MDPLSVSAALTGLLTASLEIAKLFEPFVTTYDYARTVHDEIHHFRFILFRLNSINLAASMIDLDQVVTVLLGCMYIFSVLEREVNRLQSKPELLRRMWWIAVKPNLVDCVQRLQVNKGAICSMLLILSSDPQAEALSDYQRLQNQIAELERLNINMARELRSATASPALSGDSTSGSVTSTRSRNSFSSVQANFESTLKNSRIYRRALLGRADLPWHAAQHPSPSLKQESWSVLSGISLSEVSNYAAYNLPIHPLELYNPTWYTRPYPVVPLGPEMAEVPTLLTTQFAEGLKVALELNDMDTVAAIANYVSWEIALKMSAVYPRLVPDSSNNRGDALDSLTFFKLWLRCGGDSEAKDQRGQTAIKKALESEDWRLFKLLAQNGSDINLTWDSKTLLHHVLGEGGEAFVLGLCEDIEEEDRAEIATSGYDLERKRGQAVEVLLKLGADINAVDGWKKTALHWFSEGGHKGLAQVLLSHSANIHAKDVWGTTSLHWASEGGHKAVVDVLLSHSADINVKDRWGMTAIYYASEAGHRAVVEVLLSHGADIRAKDRWEKTALHCASWGGDKGVVEVLLSHGADVHAKDRWGATSLHWASEGGHKDVVKVLLNHSAHINSEDRWGVTALHHASKGGHKGVVKILLGRGVDINAKDRSGRTALHLALESGYKGLIGVLLSGGADINARDE